MKYLFDIFVPDHSRGLLVDAAVLKQALGPGNARIIKYPFSACSKDLHENVNSLKFEAEAESAIFIERLFAHSALFSYKQRVFLSNPEWLTDSDKTLASNIITSWWHKTYFGMQLLEKMFPDMVHAYTGFTSIITPSEAKNFNIFAHFPGKSRTRHTQDIIDLWIDNEDLPLLTVQMTSNPIQIPRWINLHNIKFFLGVLEEADYEQEFLNHGIHICTSQMEGFGHYINEARAIGALIITLDSPPMNEIIDSSCGILVPVTKESKFNHGVRFFASKTDIKAGILQAIKLTQSERMDMGLQARRRFIEEQKDFLLRLRSLTNDLVSPSFHPPYN